jgi:16S rRNA (guanine527-N7)-methyltransferase
VRLLVGDVLAALPLADPGSLIDVGSGNGSPGLVFALVRDDLEVTLLEPRARRWAFLREAARVAGRRVRVLRIRHDGYAGEPAQTVTLRAVALPLAELSGLVVPGGRVIVLGGLPEDGGAFARTGEGERLPGGVTVFRRLG